MSERRSNKRPADESDDGSQPKRQDEDPSGTPPEGADWPSPDDLPGTSAPQTGPPNLENRLVVATLGYSQIREDQYNDGGYLRIVPRQVLGGVQEVVKYLNRGHYSSAWLSKRTDNGAYEVVKVSKSDPRFAVPTRKEIEILKTIQSKKPHPNIVKLLGSFEESNGQFSHVTMVLEVMGPNLQYAIHSSGKKMHLEVVRRVSKQLLGALKYIHQRGIVHMDIKPNNIMLAITNADVARLAANNNPAYEIYDMDITNPSANIVAKLADFGLSFDKSEPARRRVPPTCPYRGPETFLTELADTYTDMWSMGCVIFEMLVGSILFDCSQYRDNPQHPFVHFGMLNVILGAVPKAPYEANLRPEFRDIFDEYGNVRLPPRTIGSPFFGIGLFNKLSIDDSNEFSQLMDMFFKYDMTGRVTAEQALAHNFLQPNGGRNTFGPEMVRQNRSQQSSNSSSSAYNLDVGSPIYEEEPSTSYGGYPQKPEDGPSYSGQNNF
uniref:non-specific serine/threonine protein kinase n=1 Tax=Caenorhabditis tropicalis TaxID=1561998 RepID=A0A1I7U5N5_9PELO